MKNIPTDVMYSFLSSKSRIDYTKLVPYSRMDEGMDTKISDETFYFKDEEVIKRKIKEYGKQHGFSWLEYGAFIDFIRVRPAETHVDACIEVVFRDNSMQVEVVAAPEETDKVLADFKEMFPDKGTMIATATDISQHGTVLFDRTFLVREEVQVALPEFYPWLDFDLNAYFKAFMESPEPILVMFGPPGTGKSTFLRTLIMASNKNAYLAYNKTVVESPAMLRTFYQASDKVGVLAYEDIDRHLAKRDNGNDLMATLLNASEGVVKHPGKKLMFSTNLESLSSIDEALLRVGRCFDILKFQLMTSEQAARARAAAGLPLMKFEGKDEWSLAEALKVSDSAQQTVNRFNGKLGFR